MSIPFIDLKTQYQRLKPAIDARIQAVLDHGQYIMGPEVGELEKALAAFTGARHAISCSSGTDALVMALMAAGIGPGDAVFAPAFTFTATAEAIIILGAEPVFVEVEEASFNVDLAHLEQMIAATRKEGRLTPKAVIAVDLFGLPADYRRLAPLCDKEGLFLLDDAAQSFGGALDGRRVGTLAHVTATSFFPAKPLGCYGDGGAVFTDDDELADRMRSIRLHGKGSGKYDIVRMGINGRLDTIQAAILLPKLEVFPAELEARERVSRRYDEKLKGAVTLPPRVDGASSAWAQYTIRLPDRDGVATRLKEKGVPSAVYYPRPMHLQPAYQRYGDGEGSLPVSERLSGLVLSLPMHPELDDATVDRIVEAVLSSLKL